MAITTHTIGNTKYYVRGDAPKLLILSGTHGDEAEVTDCVTHYIDTHQADIPDYVYIPVLSPSAVELKTRRNIYGNDLNREFTTITTDKEALAAMEIFRQFTFDLAIAFHEDPDRTTSFYMYDTIEMNEYDLAAYKKYMLQTGAKLYTGIDDPADEKLAQSIVDGYIAEMTDPSQVDHGFSQQWLVGNHIAKRSINPEIPGKADKSLKQRLVDAVFAFSKTFIT